MQTKNKPADASASASRASQDAKPADTKENAKPLVTAGVKRQRTLMDMFSNSSSSSNSAELGSKKLKTGATSGTSIRVSSSSGSFNRTGAAAVNFGLQPLNSIPFSLSEYQESLTDDQKRLLKLECDTMGKSWWVVFAEDTLRNPHMTVDPNLQVKDA